MSQSYNGATVNIGQSQIPGAMMYFTIPQITVQLQPVMVVPLQPPPVPSTQPSPASPTPSPSSPASPIPSPSSPQSPPYEPIVPCDQCVFTCAACGHPGLPSALAKSEIGSMENFNETNVFDSSDFSSFDWNSLMDLYDFDHRNPEDIRTLNAIIAYLKDEIAEFN